MTEKVATFERQKGRYVFEISGLILPLRPGDMIYFDGVNALDRDGHALDGPRHFLITGLCKKGAVEIPIYPAAVARGDWKTCSRLPRNKEAVYIVFRI